MNSSGVHSGEVRQCAPGYRSSETRNCNGKGCGHALTPLSNDLPLCVCAQPTVALLGLFIHSSHMPGMASSGRC